MPITNLPGVYYFEEVTYESKGNGSKIPVFIGKTNNTLLSEHVSDASTKYKTDGTVVLRFESFEDVFRPVKLSGSNWETNTGLIYTYTKDNDTVVDSGMPSSIPANNLLVKCIKNFLEEAKLQNNDDIGVPYFYVVDLGTATDWTKWTTAMDTVKKLYDAPVEVYVGMQNMNTQNKAFEDLVYQIADKNYEASKKLNLRYAFVTKPPSVATLTDDEYVAELKAVSDACVAKFDSKSIQHLSRVGLIDYDNGRYAKTIARICCTPYSIEPGYYVYRSVKPDTFPLRTDETYLSLQNKGIIFNRDEYINGNKYPKINLCTALSFNSDSRPADSLFHARFNADDLLREVFEACYSQIKANHNSTNLAYLQVRINKIVNDRVSAEEMVKYDEKTEKGTLLKVNASDDDPYALIISGQIQPQKCTIAIRVEAVVKL